jgi:hypothetical protein
MSEHFESGASHNATGPDVTQSDRSPTTRKGHDEVQAWYVREKWLVAAIAACVPAVAALAVPMSLRTPLMILGGILMIYAVILLVRRERGLQAAVRRSMTE